MTSKPVILRAAARWDIDNAIDFYLLEASEAVVLRFSDALQAALLAIGRHPATGSPQYAQELGLPALRSRRLRRFPYVVFYIEEDGSIDVWRVLHTKRDIPFSLQAP
jgi:toxin ParE1/3/4